MRRPFIYTWPPHEVQVGLALRAVWLQSAFTVCRRGWRARGPCRGIIINIYKIIIILSYTSYIYITNSYNHNQRPKPEARMIKFRPPASYSVKLLLLLHAPLPHLPKSLPSFCFCFWTHNEAS